MGLAPRGTQVPRVFSHPARFLLNHLHWGHPAVVSSPWQGKETAELDGDRPPGFCFSVALPAPETLPGREMEGTNFEGSGCGSVRVHGQLVTDGAHPAMALQ